MFGLGKKKEEDTLSEMSRYQRTQLFARWAEKILLEEKLGYIPDGILKKVDPVNLGKRLHLLKAQGKLSRSTNLIPGLDHCWFVALKIPMKRTGFLAGREKIPLVIILDDKGSRMRLLEINLGGLLF